MSISNSNYFYFKSKIFISLLEYSSGLKPTLVLILSNINIIAIVKKHPNIINTLAVVVNLSKNDAKKQIKDLNIFSNILNDDDILFLKLDVVKLFKYLLIRVLNGPFAI